DRFYFSGRHIHVDKLSGGVSSSRLSLGGTAASPRPSGSLAGRFAQFTGGPLQVPALRGRVGSTSRRRRDCAARRGGLIPRDGSLKHLIPMSRRVYLGVDAHRRDKLGGSSESLSVFTVLLRFET